MTNEDWDTLRTKVQRGLRSSTSDAECKYNTLIANIEQKNHPLITKEKLFELLHKHKKIPNCCYQYCKKLKNETAQKELDRLAFDMFDKKIELSYYDLYIYIVAVDYLLGTLGIRSCQNILEKDCD